MRRRLALADLVPEPPSAGEANGASTGEAAALGARRVDAREAPGDPVVVLERVVKRFGAATAVDHLDLEIRRGEFFSLLGPSGCGKTTTLRLIGGFEAPNEGVVRLDGQDVTGLPAYRRDVNTVFQSYGLFPHLNVFDNVAFGLRRRHVAKNEVDRRVVEALDLVGLGAYRRRRPAQMSGGQQQRVALARALVNRPQVLLLDEPLGALDLRLRRQMQLELKRIQKEVGITFVFVTHDQEEAMTISDRIAVMSQGRIEQLGPPEEVYERPATVFVAEFLGVSNLLEGTYLRGHEGWGLVELTGGVMVRVPADPAREPGERLHLGVRPEKIEIHPAGAALAEPLNTLAGTLRSAVFVGVSYQYFFEASGGQALSAFDRNSGGGAVARPGEAVRLAWRPEHTFVIPADRDERSQPSHEHHIQGEES